MEHLKEEIIEQYLVNKEELSSIDVEMIEKHLHECSSCSELLNNLASFYKEINDELANAPTARDEEFAKRLLPRKPTPLPLRLLKEPGQSVQVFDGYTEIFIPQKKSLVKKFVGVFKVHPVKTTGSLALSFGIILTVLLLYKGSIEMQSPAYAKIENQVLKVYDYGGYLMWTKITPGIPDTDIRASLTYSEKKYVLLKDIDDDGINEVLLTGNTVNDLYSTDTLYCFEYNGKLRWKTGAGESITFGEVGRNKYSYLEFIDCFTIKVENSIKLFAIINEHLFSLSKLIEIDPGTGEIKQSYFNRGGSKFITKIDIDSDGEDELILAGINDSYNYAYVAALDPNNINGYSPVTDEHIPIENIHRAKEKYYILLPKSKIWELYGQIPYNIMYDIKLTGENNLWIYTKEKITEKMPHIDFVQVLYLFGTDLKVLDVAFGDNFIRANDWLLEQGIIKESLIPKSAEELKNKVMYWDGDKFVTTHARNKYYRNNDRQSVSNAAP